MSFGDSATSETDTESLDENTQYFLEQLQAPHGEGDFPDREHSYSPPQPRPWQLPMDSFIKKQARDLRISLQCRKCDRDGDPRDLVLCSGCGASHQPIHRRCLERVRRHRPDRNPGTAEGACTEVDFRDYVFTKYLLHPPARQKKLRLHADDITCSWIGIPTFQKATVPQIHVWPRIHNLLDTSREAPARRYPSLVSFIGETGSGKSTLIRTMIRMSKPDDINRNSVPVPGLPRDRYASTSSDIHVYADPITLSTEYPIFFVDSEGLSGSESSVSQQVLTSLSTQGKLCEEERGTIKVRPEMHRVYQTEQDQILRNVEEFLDSAQKRFDLQWGRLYYPDLRSTSDIVGSAHQTPRIQQDTRQKVVQYIYPRLLYAFSDVVCFVTTNSRTSERFLTRLIDWAKESHDRIINQRTKPALIVILNKDDGPHDTSSSLSEDPDPAEELLLVFQGSQEFQRLKALLTERGQVINNPRDVLLCYYSSFKVVVVPALGSTPALVASVSSSIMDLYEAIEDSAREVRCIKERANADLDLTMLDENLNRILEVLGRDHRVALDLHHVVAIDPSIPTSFSEHMAATLLRLSELRGLPQKESIGGERQLVEAFTPYLAACIVTQLPWDADQGMMRRVRERLVEEAKGGLDKFKSRHWRCEAKSRRMGRRCANYSDGHEDGHQFQSSEGFTSQGGRLNHRCSWDPRQFVSELWRMITQLRTKEEAMSQLTFQARDIQILEIQSQRTCLACLSNPPTNMLPCQRHQHGICQNCLGRFSRPDSGESVLVIDRCPLGCALRNGTWSIRVKPVAAGPRILTLDGGGVRGLVELCILRQIEQQVGYGIKLNELFDLVIGTSTGGIIALGVFDGNWPLNRAIRAFRSLARKAFAPRLGLVTPIIKSVVQPFITWKYTNEGIERALKEHFGDSDYLFGQPTRRSRQRALCEGSIGGTDWVKVGVVSCFRGRTQAALIANYSRHPRVRKNKVIGDYLLRQDQQADDFKIWEAARATSAAPIYFHAFYHKGTKREYEDGAIVCNNPVQLAYGEVEKIWPDSVSPDILLSIGTGVVVNCDSGEIKERKKAVMSTLTGALPAGLRRRIEIVLDVAKSTLNCQETWENFLSRIPQESRLSENCHRLNVGLRQRVNMDDVDKMDWLLRECDKYLDESPEIPYLDNNYPTAFRHIEVVSRRLLASLFYYNGHLEDQMEHSRVQGHICCRLVPGSASAERLLADGPIFRLRQKCGPRRQDRISRIRWDPAAGFDLEDLSLLVNFEVAEGTFRRSIELKMPNWDSSGSWVPISGF